MRLFIWGNLVPNYGIISREIFRVYIAQIVERPVFLRYSIVVRETIMFHEKGALNS